MPPNTVHNPIIRGFNPDPSIIRVEDDYYIATSTFEWFPGVQIHHSKDLTNWALVTRPLQCASQLDMRGNPDSGGVWAPCLSYDQGVFYLVYSNVRSFQGAWKDTPNYLVTATDIRGNWSEPIFLGSSGFDGSLFHADDGRKWYLSILVDHRKGKFFGGIVLQEYSAEVKRLIGPVMSIFAGSKLGITEGPHLYQRNGWYYLITAEGGTGYAHAVSLARSRTIEGPYELHPQNPVLSSHDWPNAPLQKTGHADLVETPSGDWYMVFLASRPLTSRGRCTLGRETAIAVVEWRADDWLYLKDGSQLASEKVTINLKKTALPPPCYPDRDDFLEPTLNIHFQSLRVPVTTDWLSLTDRPGHLRLYGRESLSSLHHQSLIARRVQAFHITATTALDFRPANFQQMAGLVCYYNTYHWHYLHLAGDESGQRRLQIISCDKYTTSEVLAKGIAIPNELSLLHLRAEIERASLQFYYALTEGAWQPIGPILDASILSDDYVCDAQNRYRPAFTGMFVGMTCQDLSGQMKPADFAYWEYVEKE